MNQESDKDSTVTRGHYIQNILKNANLWYTKTKNKYPRLESGIDRFYPAIQPISTIITGYGEPIIDRIDSTVDSVIKRGQAALKKESLTFKEQKEFYKAIVKTWMQDHESFESFNSLMKRNYSYVWSQKIDAQTVWFWTRSLAYNKPVEVLNLVTDILSDGCDSLCRGLVYT